MPMPVSEIVIVPAFLSEEIRISSLVASPSPSTLGSVSEMKRILSRASDAFEINSRRKISFFEYSELMMISIRRPTSAWNSCFWPPASSAAFSSTLKPS